jgi:hypothetical protein
MKAVTKSYIFVIVLAVTSFFVYNAALPTDIMEVRNPSPHTRWPPKVTSSCPP